MKLPQGDYRYYDNSIFFFCAKAFITSFKEKSDEQKKINKSYNN